MHTSLQWFFFFSFLLFILCMRRFCEESHLSRKCLALKDFNVIQDKKVRTFIIFCIFHSNKSWIDSFSIPFTQLLEQSVSKSLQKYWKKINLLITLLCNCREFNIVWNGFRSVKISIFFQKIKEKYFSDSFLWKVKLISLLLRAWFAVKRKKHLHYSILWIEISIQLLRFMPISEELKVNDDLHKV